MYIPKQNINETLFEIKTGDKYYFIVCDGEIYRDTWRDSPFDYRMKKFGNIFKTKEDAEVGVEKIKKLLNTL